VTRGKLLIRHGGGSRSFLAGFRFGRPTLSDQRLFDLLILLSLKQTTFTLVFLHPHDEVVVLTVLPLVLLVIAGREVELARVSFTLSITYVVMSAIVPVLER